MNVDRYVAVAFCVVGILAGCGPGVADFSEKISNRYYYHRTSPMDCFIAPKSWSGQTPIIPSKIVLYKSNGKYITAKREVIEKSDGGSRVGSRKFDFWILDTAGPSVYGPLSKNEFDDRVRELDLSDKLAL